MKQGQSLSTIDKERQIAAMLDINLRIVKAKCPNAIYKHIDLNAGSGWNDDFQVKGTPLVFIELAEKYLPGRWEAVFYEIDEDRANSLWARVRQYPNVTVLPLDNREFRDRARRTMGRWDVGSLLADPNGYLYRAATGVGCPVVEMAAFALEHPRIDIIANLNMRFYKSARGASRSHPRSPSYPNMHKLEDLRKVFRKSAGLISNRSHNGHTTFVRIILRNIQTRDYRAMGWYQLDSPEAQAIYQWAESSVEDRRAEGRFNQLDFGLESI